MKRIFSLLITAAMMISTASVAFAADCNYVLEPATATAAVGEVLEFTLKLDSNPGIAGFVNIMEFDSNVFERVSYIKINEDDEEEEYDAYSSWGSLTVNDGIKDQTVFQIALPSNKTGKTVLKVNYKVKSDVTNGDYTFKMYAEEAMNASGELVNVGETTATVKVTGGKEPAPAYKAFEIKDEQDPTAPNATEKYTQGFKATVIPNSDSITGVTCTLSTAGKPDYVVNEWATLAIGKVETTFAINVLNVPAGVAVTAEWNASK